MATTRPLRIAFIHPDLGIGGAERLVVDGAVGLQNLGHQVHLFTSFHDRQRCFKETRDGTLNVNVLGDRFVPRSLLGRLTLVCAILRQLILVLSLALAYLMQRIAPDARPPSTQQWPLITTLQPFDVYFVDQLSVGIPFLRWLTNTRVVFYCHFPDLLMNPNRVGQPSLLRTIYRLPLDWLEQSTTGQADKILVNSDFTANVFYQTFRRLDRAPRVVYPGIHTEPFERDGTMQLSQLTLLSINRFEGKKNLALAIEAFSQLRNQDELQLILAGGFDDRLQDNVRTLSSLRNLCEALSLSHTTLVSPTANDLQTSSSRIFFLLNLSDEVKVSLLTSSSTQALLYTPTNEHLGIVPLEAMAAGLPVLACNSGGPLETIDDPSTGRLRPSDATAWAEALHDLLTLSPEAKKEMNEAGKKRVKERFEVRTMAKGLERAMRDAVAKDEVRPVCKEDSTLLAAAMVGSALTAIMVGAAVY